MREWCGETEPLKWRRKHVHLFVCMWKLIYIHGKKWRKKNVCALGDGLFVEFVCGHATEDYKCPRVLFTAEPESSTCGSASWLNIIFKRMPLTFSFTSIFFEISSAIVAVAVFSREKMVFTKLWYYHCCLQDSSTSWSEWIMWIFSTSEI